MMDSKTDNPYSPPQSPDRVSTSVPRKPLNRGAAFALRFLLVLCGCLTAFCVFWLGAAAYELVTLQEGDYGQHTWRFRDSYLRAAGLALLIGLPSLFGCLWIRGKLRVNG